MGQVPPRPHLRPAPPSDHQVRLVSEEYDEFGGRIIYRRMFEVVSGPYVQHMHARRERDVVFAAIEEELDDMTQWDRKFEAQTGIKVDLDE